MRSALRKLIVVATLGLVSWCVVQPFLVERDGPLRVITLPEATPSSWLSTLLPEREGAMLVARALDLEDGGDELDLLLYYGYGRMDQALGRVPTPAITTYLGMQSASHFDTVVIEPKAPATQALIFLHGYAGNFNIYCWHMAEAIHTADMLVLCPSVGPRGDFWSQQGLDTVHATLDYVHARGIQRVFLAGLSNGAVGAGVIAPKLVKELSGLILVSGVPGSVKPPRLPVLVIQGAGDEMMPANRARSYAKQSKRVTYAQLHSGHFAFLSQREAIAGVLERWLQTLSATSPTRS